MADLLSPSTGIVNKAIEALGFDPIYFLGDNNYFQGTIILSDCLKNFGYGTVVYMATLIGIDPGLYEAAAIDGAGHLRTLLQIYIPVSKPAIATISLFCLVNHWNAWFDGMIYMNSPEKYPLQTYLRNVIIKMDMSEMTGDDWGLLSLLSDGSLRCVQIIIAVIPILCVYPFLQKYFVTGITLGSVKG